MNIEWQTIEWGERLMVTMTSPKANVSKRGKAFVEKPRCAWCAERFKRSRSDQRYCSGNCRRAACERRSREAVRTFCDLFEPRGVASEWLRDYADQYPDAVKRVLALCGVGYDEARRCWA